MLGVLLPTTLAHTQDDPEPTREPQRERPAPQDRQGQQGQQGQGRRGAGTGAAQNGLPQGVSREQMWYAPTKEDWEKPCLIQFQRTWEDAIAVARETGKPILICVNMDGEIASEHYAGIRYRQPEKAKLYEPYVCVMASVYRHTARDHDHEGKRIPCPRFGSVTCGEHIAIEPVLYEKFFDGKRIAPRHIMVELDENGRPAKEEYDVYYAWDTDSVFAAISDGISERTIQPKPIVRGDKTLIERVASRDIKDREVVEKAYLEGDAELRRRLLDAAKENPQAAPEELLRLAIYGLDDKLAQVARDALAGANSAGAVDVINEALRVPLEQSEKGALIAALERLGKDSARARTLAVVHGGLDTRSESIDVDAWSGKLAGASYPAPQNYQAITETLTEKESESRANPADAATKLQIAEANLELWRKPETYAGRRIRGSGVSDFGRLLLIDARDAALEAKKLGAEGWRADAVLAIALDGLGERQRAYEVAIATVDELPEATTDKNAIGVLGLFAEARRNAIYDAIRAKKDWSKSWLTDVHAAMSVVLASPFATADQVVAHYDCLKFLGAAEKASKVLAKGIESFPSSPVVHDRFRTSILEERGLDALETAYERMLARDNAPKDLEWFAGYASMVAAEFQRRRGENAESREAYDRAIAHFERAAEADEKVKDSTDHFIAMAFSGRARAYWNDKNYGRALDELLASFGRKPDAAATRDGLNLSSVDTAKALIARFRESGDENSAKKVQAALDALDPAMLEQPAFERPAPGTDGSPSFRQGRRRGR
ncbi:MAG: hypothetical protein KDC95_12235 [Planctomycetes bacterium]|nr:hypothetical protein [Planctomycetota bacterium]